MTPEATSIETEGADPAVNFMLMAERAFAQRDKLQAKLTQIVTVIDDNAATGDKKMTLDFVRQVATS